MNDGPFDIVLFGATGFTTGLAAEYLAANAPNGLRWALAGRDSRKVEAVRDRLTLIDPELGQLPVLHADVADQGSLRRLAEQARVLMNGVGPYLHHGDGVVAACARAGTDYLDLTGEPEFVDDTYARHHRTAVGSGARIVHACGIDCVPLDLGVWYTVEQLPSGVPLRLDGIMRAGGRLVPSGGTWNTALELMGRPRAGLRARRARLAAQPAPVGRTVRHPLGVPGRDRALGCWTVPLPTLDPQVVAHSARDHERYGPDFRYRHHAGLPKLWMLPAGVIGLTALATLAQVPPVRRWLRARQPSGAGPSVEQRAASWFSIDLRGSGGGRSVHTQVSGGDPAYGETSKMFAESAMCLALDDLPPTAGQVTTAVAMGDALIERLSKAGMLFRTIATG